MAKKPVKVVQKVKVVEKKTEPEVERRPACNLNLDGMNAEWKRMVERSQKA